MGKHKLWKHKSRVLLYIPFLLQPLRPNVPNPV